MRRRPSVSLSLSRLDDRITPSADGPSLMSVPVYAGIWDESKFKPARTTAAADGGMWVVGTTQWEGQQAWWGTIYQDWAVVKLTSKGTIDPIFNGGQVLAIDSDSFNWFQVQDLREGPHGRLTILSRNSSIDEMIEADKSAKIMTITPPPRLMQDDFAVVRITPEGRFDSSFDSDGMAFFDVAPPDNGSHWISSSEGHYAVDDDGSIVIAAVRTLYFDSDYGFSVDAIRLTNAGSVDPSFGDDGRISLDVESPVAFSYATAGLVGLDFGTDGSVMMGGSWEAYPWQGYLASEPNFSGLFAARFTPNGEPDPSFGDNGVAVHHGGIYGPNGGSSVNDFAVGVDGLYFVGTMLPPIDPFGIYPYPQTTKAVIVRLTDSGYLDRSFDDDGVLLPHFGEGRIVISGHGIVALVDGGIAFLGEDVLPPPEPFVGSPILYIGGTFVVGQFTTNGTVKLDYSPIHLENVSLFDNAGLEPDGMGRLTVVDTYPSQILVMNTAGGSYAKLTIPYERRGRWVPPSDFVPFPRQAAYRSSRGDFNGDGTDDYVNVTGAGTYSGIRIVDGQSGEDFVTDYMPYEPGFIGGMFLEVVDFEQSGKDSLVISPDEGGSARVQIFDWESGEFVQRANFFAIEDPNFRGGGSIAAADVNGDGTPDLLVGAAKGGSQRIATFDGRYYWNMGSRLHLLNGDYFAPLPGVDPATYRGGVSLRSEDVDDDLGNDVIMAPAEDESNAVVLFHSTSDGRTFHYRTLATASLGPDQTAGLFEYDMATNVSRSLG